MQGELAKSGDHNTLLEVEVSKLNNKCEVGYIVSSVQLPSEIRVIMTSCCRIK
jgi:hypothetical protein